MIVSQRALSCVLNVVLVDCLSGASTLEMVEVLGREFPINPVGPEQ